ncbi:MAG: GTP-binding protein [Candidatus Helarchaeota archaeon]|nr:GTP-binding protein [Candidatus Helarchaeota archaeon]
MVNEKQILKGIIYTVVGEFGPEVKDYYPQTEFDLAILELVAIKSMTLLTGEEGRVPKEVSIIPFVKYQLIGIVYHFELKDESKRGGARDSNLTVLFNEKYSSLAYKYSEQFEKLLREVANKIIEKEISNNEEKIEPVLKELYQKLLNNLDSIREAEKRARERVVEKKPDFRFKVVVIGDAGVGKTTLLLRFVDDSFQESYLPTIGVNVCNKKVSIANKNIHLNIFDIAGQEKFSLMRRVFYEDVNSVLIMYDVSNKESFDHIESWIKDVSPNFSSKKPIGLIIGNKIDLKSKRVITRKAAEKIAEKFGLGYVETSAKTGEKVNEAFKQLAEILVTK